MKPIVKVILSAAVLLGIATLFVVGSVVYWFATKQSDREIVRNLQISTEWSELTAEPPLRPTKQVQYLIITIDGYKRSVEDTRNQIPLPDGTTTNPDVILVDENGKTYRLHGSLLVSSGVGYTADSSFLRDKSFTKVRIRSDKPFRASTIYWENVNLK
jgi:hypothetical protein